MEYLIVVPVEFYPIDSENAACESAFAGHLKTLLNYVDQFAPTIHIVSPAMSEPHYRQKKNYLATLNAETDKIRVTCLFPSGTSRIKYNLTEFPRVLRSLRELTQPASVVHAGPSSNPLKIFEFAAIYIAARKKIPTVFVVDIDERESAHMDYINGNLSKKSYFLRKYVYDRFFVFQVKFAVNNCTLCLFKSASLCKDYGSDSSKVHNFLDTAHASSDIISPESLVPKLQPCSGRKFRLLYFGRLTQYKGIEDMIEAVDIVATQYSAQVSLTIIGVGEQKEELQSLVKALPDPDIVEFLDAIPYGQKLFEEIQKHDVLLAAPQRQDTPRNVFDAMCNGLPVIAYDIYYYRDLEISGAVITSPWKDIEKFARAIVELYRDDQQRIQMIQSAVTFARDNTQTDWLLQRKQWLEEALDT